jgi:hypothetical protein
MPSELDMRSDEGRGGAEFREIEKSFSVGFGVSHPTPQLGEPRAHERDG